MTTREATKGVTVVKAPEASQHLQQTALSCAYVLALATSYACKRESRRARRRESELQQAELVVNQAAQPRS